MAKKIIYVKSSASGRGFCVIMRRLSKPCSWSPHRADQHVQHWRHAFLQSSFSSLLGPGLMFKLEDLGVTMLLPPFLAHILGVTPRRESLIS